MNNIIVTPKGIIAGTIAFVVFILVVAMAQAKAWDGKLPVNMYSAAPVPFLNLTPK